MKVPELFVLTDLLNAEIYFFSGFRLVSPGDLACVVLCVV